MSTPSTEKRRETREGKRAWWHLHWPRDPALFTGGPRLLAARQARRPVFAWAEGECWVDLAVNVLRLRDGGRGELERLLALLRGSAFERWYRARGKRKGDILQIDAGPLLRFPVQRSGFPAQTSSLR